MKSRLRALSILLALVLLLSPCLPLMQAAAEESLLFTDDFEDGNAAGWSGAAANWSVVADGGYRYKGKHVNNETVTVRTADIGADVAVEASVRAVAMDAANGSVGLIVRYTDNNNYYLFYYHNASKTYRILKKKNGAFSLLASGPVNTWDAGGERTLRAEAAGGELRFYSNGVLQKSHTDADPLTGTRIGMRLNWAEASFDDIGVRKLDPAPGPFPFPFGDDFEDGLANGWNGVSGAWSVISDGSYRYRGVGASGEAASVIGDPEWKNIAVSAKIKLNAIDGTSGSAGLYVRYVDPSTYYLFYYHKPTSAFRVVKRVGGTFTDLGVSRSYSWASGTELTLKAEVSGNSIRLLVNGETMVTAVDNAIPAGKIGLRVNWADASYDDVEVGAAASETMRKLVFLYNLQWFTTLGSFNGPNSYLLYDYERNVVRMLNYPTSPPIKPDGAAEPVAMNTPAFWSTIKESARRDLRQMQKMGADVVNFDMGPRNAFDPAKYVKGDVNTEPMALTHMQQWLDAAEELGTGMKIGFYADIRQGNEEDPRRINPDTGTWIDILKSTLQHYGDHPSVFRVDGKPYVGNFGTQQVALNSQEWPTNGWKAVYDAVKAYRDFFFVPDVGHWTVNADYARGWQEASDAVHLFNPAGTADFTLNKMNAMETQFAENNHWMWRPGYYSLGGTAYTEPNFADMDALYRGAINNPNAKWMGVMTWNDMNEDHDIWPSALKGDVLTQLNRYYIKWFKDGAMPANYDDKIFIMYPDQLMPTTARATGQMYYWAVLKEPRTLEIDGFAPIEISAGSPQFGTVGKLDRSLHTKPYQATVKDGDGQTLRSMSVMPSIDGTHRWDERLTYRYLSLIEDHKASQGYDMLQGMDNWSYESWDGSGYAELVYDKPGASWKSAADPGVSVRAGGQSPGESLDAVRTWTAPHEGSVRIAGNAAKDAASVGGDGVNVRIAHNGTTVFEQALAGDHTAGLPIDVTLNVNKGDKIRFVTGKGPGTAASDKVVWDPTVSYLTNQAPLLPAPDRIVAMPNDAKVKLGWNDVAGAASYRVERSAAGAPYEVVAIVKERSYEDFRLVNGTAYAYRIVPVAADGVVGTASAPVAALPNVVTNKGSDYFTHSQGKNGWYLYSYDPASGKMDYLTYDAAQAAWTLPSDPALQIAADEAQPGTAYDASRVATIRRTGEAEIAVDVSKLAAGGDGVQVRVIRLAGRQVLASVDIAPNDTSTHTISVRRSFNNGEQIGFEVSKGGSTVEADRVSFDPAVTYFPGNPLPPAGLTAAEEGDQAVLVWNEVPGAQYYRVKRSESPAGPYVTIGYAVKTAEATNRFEDGDIAANGTYYYRVSTVNSDGVKWGYGDESGQDSAIASIGLDRSGLEQSAAAARNVHDAAVEGSGPGQFPAGSRAALADAIAVAESVLARSDVTQAEIDAAAAALDGERQAFLIAAAGDLDDDGVLGPGDLEIAGASYGRSSGDDGWGAVREADFDGDGRIGLRDLVELALKLPVSGPGAGQPSGGADGSGQTFSIASANEEAALGDEVVFTVTGDQLAGLYGYEATLAFNDKKLRFEGVLGSVAGYAIQPHVQGGKITFAFTRTGPATGLNGSSPLFALRFTSISPGKTEVRLDAMNTLHAAAGAVTGSDVWYTGAGTNVLAKPAAAFGEN